MILETDDYFDEKIQHANSLMLQMVKDFQEGWFLGSHLSEWQTKYIEFFTNFTFDFINLFEAFRDYKKLRLDSQKDFHMGFITHLCWQNGVPYNPSIVEMIYNGLTPSARNQRNVNLMIEEIQETYKDLNIFTGN
jgi:hypothetical protein